MVGPSLPFLMFLFVSTSSLSFLHATFTFLTTHFPSLTPFFVSSSPSFLTHHSHHIIYPPCCRQRVKVLPTVMERRSLLMTYPWRLRKVRRLPIPNRIVLRRRKGVATVVLNASSHRSMAQYPFTLPGGTRWPFASFVGLCLVISRIAWFRNFLGSVGFLHPRSCYSSGRHVTRAHPFRIRVEYIA